MKTSECDADLTTTGDEPVTLMELVIALQESADNDSEVVATLCRMVEVGRIRLARIDVNGLPFAA